MRKNNVIDTILTKSQQNLVNFNVFHPLEIKIEDNQILNILKKHKQVFYRFISVGLLFSSGIKNKTNQIFIVSNGLGNTRDSLINGKPFKILGVVNVDSIYNWEKTKWVLNWINVTTEDSDTLYKAQHFAFGFKTQNLQDILSFRFTLLDSYTNKIEFVDDGNKVTIVNFKTKTLQRFE